MIVSRREAAEAAYQAELRAKESAEAATPEGAARLNREAAVRAARIEAEAREKAQIRAELELVRAAVRATGAQQFSIRDCGTENKTEFALSVEWGGPAIARTSTEVHYSLWRDLQPVTLEQVMESIHLRSGWKVV